MPHGTCGWDKEGSGQPPGGDISWGLESHGDVFIYCSMNSTLQNESLHSAFLGVFTTLFNNRSLSRI